VRSTPLLLLSAALLCFAAILPPPVAALNSTTFGANPPSGLNATELAVVVNVADPLSVAIGAYYVKKRHIPKANVVRVRFDYRRDELPPGEFASLRASIEKRVGAHVQAYALTWARPYRVGCMSVTSAFAFGFDTKYCASGCVRTQGSPYFNTSTAKPYDDLHIRPAMSIAAADLVHARALIDRGVRADGTRPHGTAYLVIGDDPLRKTRSAEYAQAGMTDRSKISVEVVQKLPLEGRTDVLFYFAGAVSVPAIESNRFLPGAVADHLTSYGGMLTDSPQMSSLRWLEAGATGSYGTVIEPCAFLGKFPSVPVLLSHYLAGETLIEAYWKSVAMPGQGLFIGEPLSAPFRAR
jgi:uncharacterized protein (TIGR03790 family)